LKETEEDCCTLDTPVHIHAVPFIFAIGVTIALIIEINLLPLVFTKGVVSDHELCTALCEKVLQDGGSSVDAAIVGALCLGIVHPHVSGVGGGGVMLVHNARQNRTKVINFQGRSICGSSRDALGVAPLSWNNIISRAADLAREGFNFMLENFNPLTLDTFIPDGQALRFGSYIRRPDLAEVLETGVRYFYQGEISVFHTKVQANGGVLNREDIRNYSVEVQQPLESQYNEHIIKVPPLPSAGAVLIAALNLLETLHLWENDVTENQTSRWIDAKQWCAKYNQSMDLIFPSKGQAAGLQQRMKDVLQLLYASNSTIHPFLTEQLTGQVVIMGPDDLIVSVASSLNRPFGSRIMTESGIILNSLILDFFWPNQRSGLLESNQNNVLEPGKRPLTFLMPAVMVPTWNKCGTYMALSSSGGTNRLNEVTKVCSDLKGQVSKVEVLSPSKVGHAFLFQPP
uniref:Gamma-glutamyltransferase 7-like n=1 Tax=Cyprinodon variegatus TaxID=28743 RepID=A0A3Q2DXH1_CYPVA